MSSNTILFLPAHAETKLICQFIMKFFDYPYVFDSFSQTKKFDPELPPTTDNPWFIKFKNDYKEFCDLKEPSYFYFNIEDVTQKFTYSIPIYLETPDRQEYQYTGGKLIFFSCNTIYQILATRLAQFFGGKVILNDGLDEDTPNYLFTVKKGIYSPAKYKKNNDVEFDELKYSNQKFYDFYYSLNSVHPICVQDFHDLAKKVFKTEFSDNFIYSPRVKNLFDTLTKIEFVKKLDETIPQSFQEQIKNKI